MNGQVRLHCRANEVDHQGWSEPVEAQKRQSKR